MPSTTFSNFKLRIFKSHSKVISRKSIARRELSTINCAMFFFLSFRAKRVLAKSIKKIARKRKCVSKHNCSEMWILCRCTHTCYLTVKILNVIMCTRSGEMQKKKEIAITWCTHTNISTITQFSVIGAERLCFFPFYLLFVIIVENILTFNVCCATVVQRWSMSRQHWCSNDLALQKRLRNDF